MIKHIETYLETIARKIVKNEMSPIEAVLKVFAGGLTLSIIVVSVVFLLIRWVLL